MTIPVVHAAGDARARGSAVGEALADAIHRSLAFYRGFLERRRVGAGDLSQLLGSYRRAADEAYPELMFEMDAVAAAAGVDAWELFAANAWEELEPLVAAAPVDRCTGFAVSGPVGTVLAHNEQWYAGDAWNTAVIVSRPKDGPAFASPTVAACLPAVGLSQAGFAQGVMSLVARDDGQGIPRVPTSSSALRAGGSREAVRRATVPGRSGGYAYVVGAAGGETFTVETSATRHAVLDDVAAHTNHYLDPLQADDGFVSEGSVSRLRRLRSLLEERRPHTPDEAMAVLADHDAAPQAICAHPDAADDDEGVAVVFSMVCHVEERRMWVAEGNPCAAPFEEIDLAGALR
jgi:isopenicillin-N N-acyltransferase like protein